MAEQASQSGQSDFRTAIAEIRWGVHQLMLTCDLDDESYSGSEGCKGCKAAYATACLSVALSVWSAMRQQPTQFTRQISGQTPVMLFSQMFPNASSEPKKDGE